jgi:hypothetical protein
MKKLFLATAALMVLIGLSSLVVSCGSSSPNSPAATPTPGIPTATATLSAPSASVTFTLTTSGRPDAVRYGDNALWIFDQINKDLQAWTTTGTGPSPNITSYNSGTAFTAAFGDGVDPATGNVYQSDANNHTFVAFSSTGTYLGKFGSVQLASNQAECVAVNAAGTTVYGGDGSAFFAYSIGGSSSSPTYTYQSTFGAGLFNSSQNLSFDSSGNLWVADYGNGRAAEMDSSLSSVQKAVTLTTVTVSPRANDVAVDNAGNIFVADYANNVVQEFNAAGQHLYNFGAGGVGTVFAQIEGLTFDPTFTHLYVADYGAGGIYGFKVR